MVQQLRMTETTVQVLQAFATEPDADRYGLQIMALTGFPSGTVFPILARLERVGWLESGWETVDPRDAGRPRRRYYHLTELGLAQARTALGRVARERSRRASLLRPAAGAPGGLA